MKRFILSLAGFASILLLMMAIIEVGLLYRPNLYAYKRQYLDRHADDIKVLLLGSSHIEEGIKPELIGDGTFNLAISARLNKYDAALAEMYVPRLKNLKVLVMPLDYTNFSFGRVKKIKNAPKGIDLSSTCSCMHTKYMGTRVDPVWYWSEILNSKLNFMSRFWNRDEKVLQECDSLGYIALDIKDRQPGWEHYSKPSGIDPTMPIDSAQYNAKFAEYETIAKVTAEAGIRFLIITAPVNEHYKQAMDSTITGDMLRFVGKLKQKYPHVEFYDFTYADGFEADDFHDASHLNDPGAVKFSRLLANVITPPKH